MPSDRVTVVVPTYNERENLEHIAAAVLLHGYSLLVVDDASPDGTGRLADDLSRSVPNLAVLHRPRKEGLGPAYAAGFDRALDEGAEVVVEMDADFSHNPSDIPRLLEAVDAGADLVIGSRYVAGGSTPDWPWHRRVLSRGGNWYVRTMLAIDLGDATAGFRAFRASALRQLPYRTARASGYGFQVEMAWRACRQGLDVREVPIVFRDRERGKSKMGASIVMEAMWLVTRWGVARLVGHVKR